MEKDIKKDPFEKYIKETEPQKRDKSYAWYTAIGLQAVDGLKTSEYLQNTAKKNIEGEISVEEAQRLIENYYSCEANKDATNRTEEADMVAARIAALLSENAFVFSPTQYISIHEKLFRGIYAHAGKIRDYNITKAEWVLDGDTVHYGGASELRATLNYDLDVEKQFSYSGLTLQETIEHLARFVANLWQIHVFGEGNTRTTAVFFIKYLRTLGFDVTNDIFAENAWYFRNALVRANYNNLQNGVNATYEYLENFLRNLLLGENNELKNRYMHIRNVLESPKCNFQSANCTLDCTLDELRVIEALRKNSKITQKELAQNIGKSERTVKSITIALSEKNYIERVGGKRFGEWKVLI